VEACYQGSFDLPLSIFWLLPKSLEEWKTMQQDDHREVERESSYRRGWQQGLNEAERIILQLIELGYDRRKIRQMLAIYNDHFVSEWRNNGDLEKREPSPPFNIERIEDSAASHRGYDWLLSEP
jgi:hypothetical protein